jgi:two-component system NarL family sensor kinase
MVQTHSSKRIRHDPGARRTSLGPGRKGGKGPVGQGEAQVEPHGIASRGGFPAEAGLRESLGRLKLLSSHLLTTSEEERKKAAKEIHEGLAQTLVAINLQANDIVSQVDRGMCEAVKAPLMDVTAMLRRAVEEIRKLQGVLWPLVLDDLGLIAAIQSLFREFQRAHPETEVQLRVLVREHDVPESLKIVIYRVIEEALGFFSPPDRADLLTFSLRRARGGIALALRGEKQESPGSRNFCSFPGSLVLACLKHRVDISSGLFSVSSTGTDTTIQALWPIQEYAAN